jgi:hypothetical protein
MLPIRTVAFSTLVALALNLTLLSPVAAASSSELKIFEPGGKFISSFTPFKDLNGPAGSLAVADLGTDGVSEIIVGAGKGLKPVVRAFRQDGSKLFEFEAYGTGFTGGVTLAACDLNGDGKTEIITGTGYLGGPHIRVFDNTGKFTGTQFFAYDGGQRSGVNVACGDVDNDGKVEIIASSGITGGNSVKIFDASGNLETEKMIGGAEANGIAITTADIDHDGYAEILTVPMNYGNHDITVLDRVGKTYTENVRDTDFTSATYGSSVAALGSDLYVANGAYLTPQVKKLTDKSSFAPFDGQNGYATLLSPIPEKGYLAALSVPTNLSPEASGKYIKVDLSEQKMYIYENGVELKTFLISSGTRFHPTPLAKTTVLAKIPVMTYAWNYGPGNPDNYNLPNVKWNMRILKHIYIHSAYWHNNFGHPMSHGCINMRTADAEWVYNWSTVGTTVEIVK